MKMKRNKIYVLFLLSIFLLACDQGLAPPPTQPNSFLSGLIQYVNGKNKWPPKDSVIDIRAVAFKNYPPADILNAVTKGDAFYSASLPLFVDTASFSIEIPEPPLTINYLVVAQQYGSLMEWRVIGVWTLSGDNTKPSSVQVEPGKTYDGLNIFVDFDNLPPQPFD